MLAVAAHPPVDLGSRGIASVRGAHRVADLGQAGGEFTSAGRPQAVGVTVGVGGYGFPSSIEGGDLVVDQVELLGEVAGQVGQTGYEIVEALHVDGEFGAHKFRLGNCWEFESSVVW